MRQYNKRPYMPDEVLATLIPGAEDDEQQLEPPFLLYITDAV